MFFYCDIYIFHDQIQCEMVVHGTRIEVPSCGYIYIYIFAEIVINFVRQKGDFSAAPLD